MKYEALKQAGCIYLLVPALNHKGSHPLKYVDSLVYGYLIYRSRKSRPVSINAIHQHTGLDRTTIHRSLQQLLKYGCVTLVGQKWLAVEPAGESRQLFTWKKNPRGTWQSSFAFDRTYLSAKNSGLTPICNGIYWRLVSLATPVEGGHGHLMIGPGAKKEFVCQNYIARGVRCSRKTVSRCLADLQAKGLIKVTVLPDSRRVAIGILSQGGNASFWRQKETRPREKSLIVDQILGLHSNTLAKADIAYQPEILSMAMARGIPTKTAEEVVSLVSQYCIPAKEFRGLLGRLAGEHARNKESDPSLPDHCGRLLVSEITRLGKAGAWRQYSGSERPETTLEQMNVEEYLCRLRAGSDALALLREIIMTQHVPLAGVNVPITLSWDVVWEKAQICGTDFVEFKRRVAAHMFPPTMSCKWLDRWIACGQVQAITEWPNHKIPLPNAGRRFIESLQEWGEKWSGLDDVDTADAINCFVAWIEKSPSKWSQVPAQNVSKVGALFQKWCTAHELAGLLDHFFF